MLSKNIKKPSFNVLYVLKFPQFFTTWRLSSITEDGFYIFLTSSGKKVERLSLKRFQYLCKNFIVDIVDFNTLKITAPIKSERIKIRIETSSSFKSKVYAPHELEGLIDDIDDVEF